MSTYFPGVTPRSPCAVRWIDGRFSQQRHQPLYSRQPVSPKPLYATELPRVKSRTILLQHHRHRQRDFPMPPPPERAPRQLNPKIPTYEDELQEKKALFPVWVVFSVVVFTVALAAILYICGPLSSRCEQHHDAGTDDAAAAPATPVAPVAPEAAEAANRQPLGRAAQRAAQRASLRTVRQITRAPRLSDHGIEMRHIIVHVQGGCEHSGQQGGLGPEQRVQPTPAAHLPVGVVPSSPPPEYASRPNSLRDEN